MTTDPRAITRRTFLGTGAAAAGALALPDLGVRALGGSTSRWATAGKTRHVVLVAFAGGVRSREVLEAKDNAPNLHRIASAGVTMPNLRTANLGHYGAALAIFTGNSESMGIRENERGLSPTVFERLRKDGGLAAGDVWLSTSGGAQSRLFAHSDHPDYGANYSAQALDGDGLFNVEFKKVLDSFGHPQADSEHDRAILQRLGDALDPEVLQTADPLSRPDPAQVRRVSDFVLDELTGNTARVTGPGAGDAKAIKVATNILRAFRPRLLGITLQDHDAAHGSFNAYTEIIRRNDQELGKLWDVVQADEELRDTTTILVLPEFGRDKDLNERNGLDDGDDSDDLHKVFLIAAGPDFRGGGRVLRSEARTIDVAPTVQRLLTGRTISGIEGSELRELFG